MKYTKTALLFALSFMLAFPGYGQRKGTGNSGMNSIEGLYLGGLISTNGWGGELKYMFSNQFTVKGGFETLNFSYNFNFDENEIDYRGSFKYKTGGVFLLGDYNFTKNLYVSGGVLFNSFNPKFTGKAVSDLKFGDISIPASKVGEFQFSLSPSLKISPYGGLGIRSFLGQNERVVLNLEGGMYYMGPPQIEISATGLLEPTADPAHERKEIFEKQIEQYKIYPVVKITLSVKLF